MKTGKLIDDSVSSWPPLHIPSKFELSFSIYTFSSLNGLLPHNPFPNQEDLYVGTKGKQKIDTKHNRERIDMFEEGREIAELLDYGKKEQSILLKETGECRKFRIPYTLNLI